MDEELEKLARSAEKYGIEVHDGTYRAILASELTPEVCRSFRGARRYAMARAWDLIKSGEVHYLSEGLERAWDELGEKCRELGVERVAVEFSSSNPEIEPGDKVRYEGEVWNVVYTTTSALTGEPVIGLSKGKEREPGEPVVSPGVVELVEKGKVPMAPPDKIMEEMEEMSKMLPKKKEE